MNLDGHLVIRAPKADIAVWRAAAGHKSVGQWVRERIYAVIPSSTTPLTKEQTAKLNPSKSKS